MLSDTVILTLGISVGLVTGIIIGLLIMMWVHHQRDEELEVILQKVENEFWSKD